MRSRPLRLLLRIPRLLLLAARTGILLLRRWILLSCASFRLRIRRLRRSLLKRKDLMGKSSPLSEEDILRQVETPDDPGTGSGSIPSGSSKIEDAGEEDDEGFDTASLEELTEIAEELADLPFELWHAFRAEIPTLSPFERRFFGKRLSRIIKRRGWDEYATDEIQLLIGGGIAVLRRIRIPRPAVKKEKDHAHDDRRPAGGGKNDVAQDGGPHSPFAV